MRGISGVARGGGGGGERGGALGAAEPIFFDLHLNHSLLKNAYFLEKSVKITSASRAPLQNPRLLPATARVVTPAYYYNFVEFVSSAKCVLYSKHTKQNSYSKCSAFASSALLHLFSL